MLSLLRSGMADGQVSTDLSELLEEKRGAGAEAVPAYRAAAPNGARSVQPASGERGGSAEGRAKMNNLPPGFDPIAAGLDEPDDEEVLEWAMRHYPDQMQDAADQVADAHPVEFSDGFGRKRRRRR